MESISSYLLALNERMERQDERINEISREISSAGGKSMGEQQEPLHSMQNQHRHEVQRFSYPYKKQLAKTETNSSQEKFQISS